MTVRMIRDRVAKREMMILLYLAFVYIILAASYPKTTLVSKKNSRPLGEPRLSNQKVVLLVVDGLSSRFTFPQKGPGLLPLTEAVYENKLSVFEDYAKREPGKAVHKKSTISPPTWTIDRITSLITGGYPSQDLIDLISGFSGQDHLLEDIEGKNYFFGDVIWRPILEKNSRVKFEHKTYYNFFIMSHGEITDSHLVNDTIEVPPFNPVFEREEKLQSAAHAHVGTGS